jgi:hypothetical protein
MHHLAGQGASHDELWWTEDIQLSVEDSNGSHDHRLELGSIASDG